MNRFWLACVVIGAVATTVAGCGQTSGDGAGQVEGFVCGKDGQTYSVEDAALGEHDVEHRGRCEEPMHCESPNDCFVGDACMPAPWAAGEGGDERTDPASFPSDPDAYWCIPGPTRCNCPGVFEPVCGGDRRNYINACEAACAGVGIRHEGYCEEPPGEGCVRAGCSDHLCVEEGVDIASTCEWSPVYECYQQATCERQQNGQCGFTPTHELVECGVFGLSAGPHCQRRSLAGRWHVLGHEDTSARSVSCVDCPGLDLPGRDLGKPAARGRMRTLRLSGELFARVRG